MSLDPIVALTEQYFEMRLALLVGMPISLNPFSNLQCTLPSETTINTTILVIVFLGYCLAQWKVSVKLTLVTVAHNYIHTDTYYMYCVLIYKLKSYNVGTIYHSCE